MKYIQFLLLFSFLAFASFSQAQAFKKGFIYLQNGDTLTGLIDDDSYEVLSHSVTFKLNRKSDDVTTYSPHEIKAFQFVDGDFFLSEMVQFSSSEKHGNDHDVSEMRFLHRISNNEKTSLYELNDEQARPLFFQKNGGPLQLLCLDKSGNLAYLELLVRELNDCEYLTVPANLPLEAAAIQTMLIDYDHCEKREAQPSLPQSMVWAGISIPAMSLVEQYHGLGKCFQMEFRPIANGFLSNFNLGFEFLHLNANHYEENGNYKYWESVKYRELSIKTSFFLSALNGSLRPYGFIAFTSSQANFSNYYKQESDENYIKDRSKDEYNRLAIRPGIGLHAQWKRHFLRVELPMDRLIHPRIGYGYAF